MLSDEILVKQQIKNNLHHSVQKSIHYFTYDFCIMLFFCFCAFFIDGVFLERFINNKPMLVLGLSAGTFLTIMTGLSTYMLIRFNKLSDNSQNLSYIIQTQHLFFKSWYKVWLFLKPLIVITAAILITPLLESPTDHYQINNKVMFSLIYIFIYIIILFTNFLISSHYSSEYIRGIKEMVEDTSEYETKKTLSKSWMLIFFIFLSLLLFSLLILSVHLATGS